MADMQQIHIEVYSFSEEASTLVQFYKMMACLGYKLKQKLNDYVAMYEYTFTFLILKEDISCLTLLTTSIGIWRTKSLPWLYELEWHVQI
jgi:hypothetical protein